MGENSEEAGTVSRLELSKDKAEVYGSRLPGWLQDCE